MYNFHQLLTQTDCISLRNKDYPIKCICNDKYRQNRIVQIHSLHYFFADAVIDINTVGDDRRKSFKLVCIKFLVLFFRREKKDHLTPPLFEVIAQSGYIS